MPPARQFNGDAFANSSGPLAFVVTGRKPNVGACLQANGIASGFEQQQRQEHERPRPEANAKQSKAKQSNSCASRLAPTSRYELAEPLSAANSSSLSTSGTISSTAGVVLSIGMNTTGSSTALSR